MLLVGSEEDVVHIVNIGGFKSVPDVVSAAEKVKTDVLDAGVGGGGVRLGRTPRDGDDADPSLGVGEENAEDILTGDT